MQNIITKAIGLYLNLLAFISPSTVRIKGFNIFCTPIQPKLGKKHIQFLRDSKSGSFFFDGKEVVTYQWGSGKKKALLVHGWASNTYRWKPLVERLIKEDYTIYALDAPAHGLSQGKILYVPLYQQVLAQYLEIIGSEMDIVVGHSIGAFTLQYHMHLESTFKPRKTFLLASPGEVTDFFTFYQKQLTLSDRVTKLITDEFIHRIGKDPSYFSTARFAPHIQNDIVLIHDEDDSSVDIKYSDTLAQLFPKVTYHRTKGHGHSLRSKKIEDIVLYLQCRENEL
jgi:esterase/lipase